MTARLEDNHFFRWFGAKSRSRLAASAERQTFRDGAIVFDEGSAPDWVYLLGSGQVELIKGTTRGHAVVLATVEPRDYFGEIGVMYRNRRITGARAKGRVTLYKLPGARFRKALASEPGDVTRRLSKRVLDYLRAIDERFVAETLRKEKIHLIGELAGTIIHDFKNPLTAMHLAGSTIRRAHDDELTQKCCQIIGRAAQQMMGMAQELLDFARGQMSLSKEPVPVSSLFEDFKSLNEQFLKHSRVELILAPIEASVLVDRNRFVRVLQNLVKNAVEAMGGPSGGVVRLGARRTPHGIEISVRDNGPGIPEAIRQRAFEPFVTHGKQGGTGLGLPIAKNLVEAHGGKISFATRTGQGTVFRIELPNSHPSVRKI